MSHKSLSTFLRCMMSAGVLAAVVLLAPTFALAQAYQPLPFPQAANPALVDGQRYLPLVVEANYEEATPLAIASGTGEQAPASVLAWHHNVVLGSASEPAPQVGDATPADNLELGSAFPCEANPSQK
jgi:hypothetical protein